MDDPTDEHTAVDLAPSYREAFEFLQSETRVDILLVLAEEMRSTAIEDTPGLSFSVLRKRVGVRDSGRFNYHLNQLEGTLVERMDDVYRLTVAGMQAVSTLVAGAFASGAERGPTPVDHHCPTCGDRLVARYHSGSLVLSCDADEDHVSISNLVPPGAAEGRSLEDLVEVLRVTSYHELGQSLQGVCPQCRGQFDWTTRTDVRESPNGTETGCVGQCERCPVAYTASPGMLALYDPTVDEFFRDHGIEVRESHLWRLGDVDGDQIAVVSEDPKRVAVTLRADHDAVRAVLDGHCRVVETERLDG